jgi:biotin operon repressor
MHIDFTELLQPGEPQAVHMSELAEKVGVDERTLRQMIYHARESGVPVLSSAAGYFLPGDDLEIRAFEKGMRQRARSALVSLGSVKKNRKSAEPSQIPGQMSINDFTDFN